MGITDENNTKHNRSRRILVPVFGTAWRGFFNEMNRSGYIKRKIPMPRGGRAVNEWAAARKVLKAAFERAGITHCERCGSRYALSFAHSLPRRMIPRGSPLLYECALLCTVTADYRPGCHQEIDLLGHEGQAKAVRDIIANRVTAVVLPENLWNTKR